VNKIKQLNPNSEVIGGGKANEADGVRPSSGAATAASFKPWNISQSSAHPTLLRPGRPHSANVEIQLRSLG
jgi:hypothetical protein